NEIRRAINETRERVQSEEHRRVLEAADNRSYSSKDPIHNMRKVENALNRSTARIPTLSKYFDSLARRLLKWDATNPLIRNPISPLSKAFRIFQPLQRDGEAFTEQIFREKGRTTDHDDAIRLCMRLNKVMDALEQLKQATIDGTLAAKHANGELTCQNQLWRAAVNGITGLAAWSYDG
ncbi:hypothetical protein MPER_03179, partial [Moniliophthora perniciosa FA553]